MFDFVGRRKWAYLFTGLVVVVAVLAIIIPPRIPFGLEFSSGTSLTLEFEQSVDLDDVRSQLSNIGLTEAIVQETGDGSFFIRTSLVEEGLVPILEEQFGVVRTQSYERATDLATTLLFVETVSVQEIEESFPESIRDDVIINSDRPGRFFIWAPGLTSAELDRLSATWDETYAQVDREDFDPEAAFALSISNDPVVPAQALIDALSQFSASDELILLPTEDIIILAAQELSQDEGEDLQSILSTRFPDNETTPFDFTSGSILFLSPSNDVPLEAVIGELTILRTADILGDRGTAQRVGPQLVLVGGESLGPIQDQVIKDLEDELGPSTRETFDAEGDLALLLDFGPEVDSQDFQAEFVSQGVAGVLTGEVAPNVFYLVGADISKEDQDGIIAGLELGLGRATQTRFDEPGDLVVRIVFQQDDDVNVSVIDIENQIAASNLENAFASPLGANEFVFAAKDLSAADADAFFAALEERYGEPERTPFDLETGLVVTLNFGPLVTIADLRSAVEASAVPQVIVNSSDAGFLLLGKDIPQAQRDALVADLTEEFGPARETAFDFTDGQFFTITYTDPAQAALAVADRLIVQEVGRNQIFIAGNRLVEDDQALIISTLREAFGDIATTAFDFDRGIALNLFFEQRVSGSAITQALAPFGYEDLTVLPRENDSWFVRSSRPTDDQRSTILRSLEELAPIDRATVEFSSVDAEIARRSILNTFWAVLAGTVGILAYVWWAFRRIPKSFRYGFSAIVSLSHDVLVVLGTFSILAKFTNVEINSLMVVGILAVIGYSVNNTIVVFDRIRENVIRSAGRDFELSVNLSLNETLTRNMNTSVTTLVAVLAVLLFGGESVKDFMLVLVVGIVAGTYSSLFLAPNLIVSAERGELPRLPFFRSRRTST